MIGYIIITLKKIGHHLITKRVEPHVRQKRDRFGNFYWQVYDPISRSYLFFNSELEVRIWLENRHYYN